MFVDAVLPAASELVMVYAGALAAGVFASQSVVLFGKPLDSGWPAYLAVAAAGARLPPRCTRGDDGLHARRHPRLGDRLLRRPPVRRAPRPLAAPRRGEA